MQSWQLPNVHFHKNVQLKVAEILFTPWDLGLQALSSSKLSQCQLTLMANGQARI